MTSPLYAAIDCGTNSTRLLISDGETVVTRLMTITRLGAGVDATRRLDERAVARTLEVLEQYATLLETHDVRQTRMVATSAVRDALNSAQFFTPARELLGVEPELLSGQEEAELSFLGATADLPDDGGPYLVVDLGGGSTEMAVGAARVEATASTQMGCVRLTEKYLLHDPPLA